MTAGETRSPPSRGSVLSPPAGAWAGSRAGRARTAGPCGTSSPSRSARRSRPRRTRRAPLRRALGASSPCPSGAAPSRPSPRCRTGETGSGRSRETTRGDLARAWPRSCVRGRDRSRSLRPPGGSPLRALASTAGLRASGEGKPARARSPAWPLRDSPSGKRSLALRGERTCRGRPRPAPSHGRRRPGRCHRRVAPARRRHLRVRQRRVGSRPGRRPWRRPHRPRSLPPPASTGRLRPRRAGTRPPCRGFRSRA